MSGICGIVRFDGKPISKEAIQNMLDTMENRGNDAEGVWIGNGVAFGHKMLWTTPESQHENQPFISKDGRLVITADARIDNRDELIEKLEISESDADVITDIDLIVFSYQKWGEDCPKYLVGNFSFAIWDEINQKLYCARDHVGFKPFFYYKDSDLLIFSSEISALFSYPGIDKEINQEAVECSLLFDAIAYTDTYFKDIFSLKGSTYKVCNANGMCRDIEYWNPAYEQRVRDISFEEAALELKSIYQEALSSQLRSAYPISFELSGGLDSSSIVTFADQTGFDQPAHLYSLRFGDHSCDEGKYIEAASHAVNLTSTGIRADLLDYADEYSLQTFYAKYSDWPLDLFFMPHMRLADLSDQDKCRVMLTGQGGDEVFQGSRLILADFIQQGRFIAYIKQMFSSKYKWDDLKYFTFRPLIPDFLRRKVRLSRLTKSREQREIYKYYLRKVEFKKKHYKLRSSLHMARLTFGAEHALWCNMNSYNLYGSKNIEVRHPLFDIRLIKFRLTTPPEYFYSNGRFKHLFRSAMKGILPELIRKREDKANFDDMVKLQLHIELQQNPNLKDIDTFEIKKVINKELWNMLDIAHAKRGFNENDAFLHWKLINLEYWYKMNFMKNSA